MFAREASEIGRARRLVLATLRSWGVPVDQQTLLLVTSELMTNAVRHGDGVVCLVVRAADDRVRIEVHDTGAGTAAPREAVTSGPGVGGFGLHMVEALADAWGVEHGAGTVVWAETAIDAPAAPGPSASPASPDPRPPAGGRDEGGRGR